MDDRELEVRLKTRLRARFDDAPVPVDLTANVRQAMATTAAPFGFRLRAPRRWLGWPAVAALAAVAIVAISISAFTLPGLGGRPSPSPLSTNPAASTDRQFLVLPPLSRPPKTDSSLAGDVLSARLRALGIGNFTSSIGDLMVFLVPDGGPSDASIRAVLTATGNVEFVPLPAPDYGQGAGELRATVGQPLPKDEPALFGWEGIVSVSLGYNEANSVRTINFTLKPAASAALGDYTTSHRGEMFAVLIDGLVVTLPIINEPITNAEVGLSTGIDDPFDVPAAILVGGMLPEAWRGATSPILISREQAVAAALAATNGGTVQDASQSAEQAAAGDPLQLVWNIDVVPTECADANSCLSPGWTTWVKLDAVSGAVLHVGALAP